MKKSIEKASAILKPLDEKQQLQVKGGQDEAEGSANIINWMNGPIGKGIATIA